MYGSPARIISVILTAAALTGCGSPSEITRAASVLQVPQAESLSVVARQFQNDVPYTVFFGFDEDTLDAEAKARLDAQAGWIIDNANVKFRVYGHADRVGSTDYNIDLGLRRATAAVAYLVAKGISQDRLEAMVSLGEDAPAIETEDRERANRRVVTEVFGFVTPVPTNVARNGITTISVGDPVPTSTPADESTPNDESTPIDEPATNDDPSPETDNEPSTKGKNPNSGRGNGDEDGDPGNSGGRNNGGDEV